MTLTTEVEANLSFYRRFGYQVVGRADVSSAFTSWGLFRGDGARIE